MADFSTIPTAATLDIKPFKARVPEEKLQHFKDLLRLSLIAPACFEDTKVGRLYGIERTWLKNAKEVWLNDFDWRKHEDRINSFPNFKATVNDKAGTAIELQFLALFSKKPDAIPIAFLHGWPGSICDFLDILKLLRGQYTPDDLPYHVIVPSLPGYAYSSGPAADKDYGIDTAAGAIHNLLMGLGFGSGYLVQGGDLGSFISRDLAMKYDACKGMHVNMMGIPGVDNPEDLTNEEKEALQKASEFVDTSYGFALVQGTRPATVGFALSASPLALLTWLGESFLGWTEKEPPLDKILEVVTLYWMTDTVSRCLYHSRTLGSRNEEPKMARISVLTDRTPLKLPYVEKPCGYSLFAHEIVPVPKSWAMKSCNLVSFNKHEHGGHFAAMERPEDLLVDVEEYVQIAWKLIENSDVK